MRVTHVITRLIVGGAQENTLTTVLGLHDVHAVNVDLIAGPTSGPEGSLEDRLHGRIPLLIEPHLVRPVNPLADVLAFQGLTRRLRASGPDLVHTHSGKAGVLGRLAARKAGVPVIVHTIHGPSFGPFQGPLANAVFRGAERRAGRVTTHFVSVAEAMTRQYLEAGIGRAENYTTIRSGFELAPFLSARPDPELRQRLGLSPHDFVVGKIARLFRLKGHEDLFAVAAEVIRQRPNTRFLLVGDGPLTDPFRRELSLRALDRHFIFTGLVTPDDVPKYVGIMDCLVHLSRREGLARALPQAMAAGKPVVAYDCDGAREVCRPDHTGYLLAPGDRPALVEALVTLGRSSDRCRQLGENGRRLVQDQFSADRMVTEIHSLYVRLLRAGQPASP